MKARRHFFKSYKTLEDKENDVNYEIISFIHSLENIDKELVTVIPKDKKVYKTPTGLSFKNTKNSKIVTPKTLFNFDSVKGKVISVKEDKIMAMLFNTVSIPVNDAILNELSRYHSIHSLTGISGPTFTCTLGSVEVDCTLTELTNFIKKYSRFLLYCITEEVNKDKLYKILLEGLNSLTVEELLQGKDLYPGIGKKNVKLVLVKKTNHKKSFKGSMTELKICERIVELRKKKPFKLV